MLPTPRRSRPISSPEEPVQVEQNPPWSEPLGLDYEHSLLGFPHLPERQPEADMQTLAQDSTISTIEEKTTPIADQPSAAKDPASDKPPLPSQPPNAQVHDDGELLKGIGQEAIVWTTYVKESKEFDEDMVDGWNRSLDVTLGQQLLAKVPLYALEKLTVTLLAGDGVVFAALFSAILTAFVLESAKKLEPDPAEQTVALLIQISQAIQANGMAQTSTNQTSQTNSEFHPTRHAIWVNCLWFFSLSISIAVSLAAMLAKQWCYYFISSRSGDTIAQTRERQKRFNGIARWRMRGILEHLPMLMHIALALFSIGLILYLWDVNVAVATGVSVVTMGTLFFYLATTLLPVMDQSCPFKTTQSVYATILIRYLAHHLPVLGEKLFKVNIGHSIGVFQPNQPRQEHGHRNASHEAIDIETGPNDDHSSVSSSSSSTPEDVEPFVADALQWLILNSQSSTSIDIAIGALAIGRVEVRDENLKKQVNLHLIKHFSDCFCPSKDGVKLQLSHNPNSLEHATNYINWIFYFGGNKSNDVVGQLNQMHIDFEGELVTRFGLALASLANQQTLSPAAGRNVALWLSSFVQYYEQGHMYLQEETLSVLIDGLTITSLNVCISTNHSLPVPDDRTRAQVLAIPQLIGLLWKVSHIPDSVLRASIGLNLAVFALTTRNIYPGRSKTFESAARRLAYDNRSTQQSKNSSFIPFAVFSLLGFIHQNKLGLQPGVLETAALIIHETEYLARSEISMKISQLPELDPLRAFVTPTLIECMIQTPTSPQVPRSYLLQTAFVREQDTSQWESETFESILHALNSIIVAHVNKESVLHDDAMVAATNLLLKEVKKLKKLDVTILGSEVQRRSQEIQETIQSTEQNGQQSRLATNDTPEHLASSTLALIMEKSNHKQCLETAVRAVSHHTSKCNDELVVHAAEWFARKFQDPEPNGH